MASLDQFAAQKLAQAREQALLRGLSDPTASGLNFCSNDYLGLSQDPRLAVAAIDAVQKHGAGAGASRLVTGNHSLYDECEALIARVKGTESGLVFGSGYLANLGTIPAIVGEGDLIVADELSHACMMSGAKLSGATFKIFRHNDCSSLKDTLQRHRTSHRNCLVMTEGVFSMDGDLSPLSDIFRIAREFDAWLMTDDAHGLGVIGEGRGSAHEAGIVPDIQMGSLSKAVGSYGGYVAASHDVVSLLTNRARSLVFSTGLPPAVVAASIAGLRILSENKDLCSKPLASASMFCEQARLPRPVSAIVPIILGSSAVALAASELLAHEGFLVKAIRPPTVPRGTARLRITFTARQNPADIIRLADLVNEHIKPMASEQ